MSGVGVFEVRRGAGQEAREGAAVRWGSVLPRVWAVGTEGLPTGRPRCGRQRAAAVTPGPGRSIWASGRALEGASEGARRCEGRQAAGAPNAGVRLAAAAEPSEEVAFYRKYTEALLRRYQRLRLQAGRVPSPMDREIFRGRMSHYKVHGFDDAVIFCVDVETCMRRLNGEDQRLLRRIAVQEYTLGEAAGLLGMSLRRCIVLYRRALDRLTRLFLELRVLEPEKGLSRG